MVEANPSVLIEDSLEKSLPVPDKGKDSSRITMHQGADVMQCEGNASFDIDLYGGGRAHGKPVHVMDDTDYAESRQNTGLVWKRDSKAWWSALDTYLAANSRLANSFEVSLPVPDEGKDWRKITLHESEGADVTHCEGNASFDIDLHGGALGGARGWADVASDSEDDESIQQWLKCEPARLRSWERGGR